MKYTPQPNLLTPLMGARDGFVKAAAVKLYLAAKKAPTWGSCKRAFVAAQPKTYHSVYHDDLSYDLLSESESDDEANS